MPGSADPSAAGFGPQAEALPSISAAAICLLLLLMPSRIVIAQPAPRIVNGTLTSSFPSTGALLIYDDTTQTYLAGLCSGTLVGCRTFVTAAHCVCSGADSAADCLASTLVPEQLQVFFQQAGFAPVVAVNVHPNFEFGEAGDIAVLQLAEPIAGITPTAINTLSKPGIGTGGTIVGFGRTMNEAAILSDAGLKRDGKVTVADCNRVVPNATHVCWQFVGDESSTCSGDSGGPLFIDFGDGPRLAGVTSGGINDTCAAPDRSFQTDVFVFADWLTPQVDDCSTVTPSDDQLFSLLSTNGELSRASAEQRFEMPAPAGTTAIRFALNGQLSGADFDLYVRAGREPTTTTYDCADIGSSSFGACALTPSGAATWYVLVRRAIGTGTFQLNVTALVDPSPQPSCSGDCNTDGAVTVEDLVTGVNVALGRAATGSCTALDTDSNGAVTVDELVGAVANALSGCAP